MDMEIVKERNPPNAIWRKLPYAFFLVAALLLCTSLAL